MRALPPAACNHVIQAVTSEQVGRRHIDHLRRAGCEVTELDGMMADTVIVEHVPDTFPLVPCDH